ncbi:hypothetical protein ACG02S_21955 [Roseateles sp. DC23W]|uniref:Uncharacterized protein n=1 Tax=Pelomonas dachongensis TaxID=3299029 RepID=A0ABW7ESS9_9BURK
MNEHDRREFLRRWMATVGVAALPACGGGNAENAGAGASAGAAAVSPPASGNSSGASDAATSPNVSPAPAIPAAPSPSSTSTASHFTVSAGAGVTQAPFTLGYAFRNGEIPAGQSAIASIAGVQVQVKNRWPDGSLKFALLSGVATLTSGQAITVQMSAGKAATSTTAVTLAQLKSAGMTAEVGAGAFGKATWSDSDWESPQSTWVNGPQMSSWIYRKPVGADKHLVAWLEVRCYVNGAVEILPWIENGFIQVASPRNCNSTYTFLLNGVQRFARTIDLPHHSRTPLLEGTMLSHWLGSDPGTVARQSRHALQASELVPSYHGELKPGAPAVARLPSTFVPLQQGSYSPGMGNTGYQAAIGLLPEWDVSFLASDELDVTYRAVQRNAYSAGRYPLHYRDEATQRPLRFSDHPNLSTNSSTKLIFPARESGTAAQHWDIPHHPSVGYVAYLATGRFYFLEQLQFAATRNFLGQVDNQRQYSRGIFLSASGAATTRGAAWAIRTLAQAAVATPDDDSLSVEFLASLTANVEFNYATYVAQPNNPFGIVAPYGDAYGNSTDGKVTEAPWQQDFYTAAFGYALAMQPRLSAEASKQLEAFFAWKARSVIGRLGGTGSTEWLYRDAASYTMVVATVDQPDWMGGTGPWPANWGVLYQSTLGVANPGTAGDLRGAYFPESTSYWGNLLPAISYAVRHRVPGAAEAYARMTGASNWPAFIANMSVSPVWGVHAIPGGAAGPIAPPVPPAPAPRPPVPPPPASSPPPAPTPPAPAPAPGGSSPAEARPPQVATPAWAKGLAPWQWKAIPGTALSNIEPAVRPLGSTGPSSKISAWCGATLKRKGSIYMLGAAGGHADYAGNEVNALDLLADSPRWVELCRPSARTDVLNNAQFYLDNRPAAVHTYYATQYIERLDRMVVVASKGLLGPFAEPPAGYPLVGMSRSFSFDRSKGDWDGPDYISQFPGSGDPTACLCVGHPLTGDIYYSRNSGDGWYRWTSITNRWDRLSSVSRAPWYSGAAIDTLRNRMLVVGSYTPTAPMVLNLDGSRQPVSFNGLGAEALTLGGYNGVVYDEVNDLFIVVFNDNSKIRVLTVRAADLHVADPSPGGVVPKARQNGIHNSVQYVPQLQGIVIANDYYGDVLFMRTS